MNFWTNLIAWDKEMVLGCNALHTPWLDRFAWLLSETTVWIPALLVLLYVLIKNKKIETVLILMFFALLFTFVDMTAAKIIKPLVARPRPTYDMAMIPLIENVNGYHGGHYGFLSNHAANVFAFAGFTALLFKEKWYSLGIMLWAAIVSLSRVYMAVHYPTDVISGMIFGLLSAGLFYAIYMKIRKSFFTTAYRNKIKVNGYTTSSFFKADIYLLLIILAAVMLTLGIAAENLIW